jgi:hypothetical protein
MWRWRSACARGMLDKVRLVEHTIWSTLYEALYIEHFSFIHMAIVCQWCLACFSVHKLPYNCNSLAIQDLD